MLSQSIICHHLGLRNALYVRPVIQYVSKQSGLGFYLPLWLWLIRIFQYFSHSSPSSVVISIALYEQLLYLSIFSYYVTNKSRVYYSKLFIVTITEKHSAKSIKIVATHFSQYSPFICCA
jgi:hypothetical protein